MTAVLDFFQHPASVAVVGASDDPEKIGGRPLRYMREFGYRGRVMPVNPRRREVQGMATVPSLADLPQAPDVVLVAVPGTAAVGAVATAADLGTKGCVVMSSGFGETGTAEGIAMQAEMLAAARRTGMRLIGPNSQGLATFSSGAVLGFSTLFTEDPPADGPVGIVSQSGAMASVPYGILRRRGIGVRYAHGTGNDADVSASELAASVVEDPELKLLLLYLEKIENPEWLVELGERSRRNGVPVVALVGGRSQHGSRAAASHTGALASERRVLDALLERAGIWSVRTVHELVASTELYLQDWQPRGSGLAVVSNSGAMCVLAADAAEDAGVPLAELAPATRTRLAEELPAFAATANPIDVTAALLTDSSIFGRVLPLLGADPAVDACLLAIPVAGRGYDVEQFARDAADFVASGTPLVLAIPQPSVAAPFVRAGLVVFEEESMAVGALAQYLAHRRRIQRAETLRRPALAGRSGPGGGQLNESESLAALAAVGVPVVPHEFVPEAEQVAEAFGRVAAGRAVVKGCSRDVSHKAELGLVRLGCTSPEEAEESARAIADAAARHGVSLDGFVVAPMVDGVHEVLIGAHVDPVFGPVMVIGAGGVHVEAVPDTRVLLAPCTAEEVREAIGELRMAPLLAGVRGAPAADVDAWVTAVVAASETMADADRRIRGFDANPVMLLPAGRGARAVDAVVLLR
ncbi:acetate--CoA ligase family protein [Blastococcus capsensis]|uniref:acetate--CoA ligase family protein n=1 Tax=Blastococcus capsensis TaxID=1564163 RepID=UPI002540DDC6|nr:acetate--CoA ligase family protein [Blastococcus capsensis]MDK3257774.1 acetate--CoA ligase family protein [Blastococcus capsensis]